MPVAGAAVTVYNSYWSATASLIAGVGGALSTLRTSRWLALLMVQGVAMFTLVRICQVNLFQPILESKSLSVNWYGAVLAAMTVFEALGAARPHRSAGRSARRARCSR